MDCTRMRQDPLAVFVLQARSASEGVQYGRRSPSLARRACALSEFRTVSYELESTAKNGCCLSALRGEAAPVAGAFDRKLSLSEVQHVDFGGPQTAAPAGRGTSG